MIGGDENSAKDDGIQLANCNLIQRELDCAVLVIHHSNKADLAERGSGASRNGAESVIAFSRDDDLITLTCSRLKDGEKWPPESYRFVKVRDSVVHIHLAPGEGAKFMNGVISGHGILTTSNIQGKNRRSLKGAVK